MNEPSNRKHRVRTIHRRTAVDNARTFLNENSRADSFRQRLEKKPRREVQPTSKPCTRLSDSDIALFVEVHLGNGPKKAVGHVEGFLGRSVPPFSNRVASKEVGLRKSV